MRGRELREEFSEDWGQYFSIDEVLFERRTDHQHLIIFRNALYGRVMALDGIIQTTEGDEFVYHEMLCHVALVAHGRARRVLIVGGGDGGMLREVLRHRDVVEATQVEIDGEVIEMSKRYLPNHSRGAFDDARVQIVIDDGLRYVTTTEERFDVIISDSTDPIGPGEALFGEAFYAGCKRCLTEGGLLVTQNGSVFEQFDQVRASARSLRTSFADVSFFCAAVPTYVGGLMAFGWATDDETLRELDDAEIAARWRAKRIETRYYTPAMHRAAFALPRYVEDAVIAATDVAT